MKFCYAIAVFLSAFLLFQVQPLIGKFIMPWFGTTPGVWATCLVFFQLMLLAGYGYAHLIAGRLSRSSQIRLHLALLVAALLALPIIPSPDWKTTGDFDPALRILLLLSVTVGFPYLLLASTAPLLQKWFHTQHAKSSPYRLYAVSNAGSLLALISYPLFFERFFRLTTQTLLWSGGFFLFVLLVLVIARVYSKEQTALSVVREEPVSQEPEEGPGGPAEDGDPEASLCWKRIALWIALSAIGSLMLVATTNRISQDIPAVPFLFVLPLGIYLATFIIAFDSPRWYFRPLFCVLLVLGIIAACIELYRDVDLGIQYRIGIYAAALFGCCACCHGELARLKPSPRRLTSFYLAIAFGGALGGVLVVLVAPFVFEGLWEYEIGLIASFALVMFLVTRDLFRKAGPPAAAGRRGESKKRQKKKQRTQRPPAGRWAGGHRVAWAAAAFSGAGCVALVGVLGSHVLKGREDLLAQDRSFYGVVRVFEEDKGDPGAHRRSLFHGSIMHGLQMQHPKLLDAKIAYYSPESGIGMAVILHPKRRVPGYGFRMGVVGLGTGTLGVYANDPSIGFQGLPGINDYLEFYEIDPMVVRFADDYFTYLKDARQRGADVVISVGDARIVMEQQLARGEAREFDILAIDAFSGDSIPMHLLTKECYQTYLGHLKPDGILAFHITSRYLDLLPVVKALAEEFGQELHVVDQKADTKGHFVNRWALVTHNGRFSSEEVVHAYRSALGNAPGILWTDDFGNLFDVVK